MKLYIYIFILLLLCIFPLDAQQERSESYIRISAPVSLAGALDEIESQTNYSFIYDAQVINLSEKVRKPLSGRSVFEILNLLFKNTEIVYIPFIILDQGYFYTDLLLSGYIHTKIYILFIVMDIR